MKKLVLLALLVFAAYRFFPGMFPFLSPSGAFDKSGKPLVVFFVGPQCGAPCDTVKNLLTQRNIPFSEVNLAGPDGAPVKNRYGVSQYPTTLIGQQEIVGDDTVRIGAALAEAFGIESLPRMQRLAMANHFDAEGRAKVFMYGTNWCPYCKQQRAFFEANGVAYEEVDVESSQSNAVAYRALEGNGYPLTYVGYRRFVGYKEQEILKAIDELKAFRLRQPG